VLHGPLSGRHPRRADRPRARTRKGQSLKEAPEGLVAAADASRDEAPPRAYRFLFFALLGLTLTAGLEAGNPYHRLVMLALGVIVFGIAVWAMWLRPWVRYIALFLAVLSIGASTIDVFAPEQPALRALLMSSSAFFALTIYRVLRRVLNISTVTQESLFGAGSVYLLIGLAFSTIYYVVWKAVPTAFLFDPARTTVTHGWPDFVYFSFTTLATVGFGDIVPVLPIVRSMVVLEIITGVFFVAVIISKLVSLYRLR
jgi:hypothetical protein